MKPSLKNLILSTIGVAAVFITLSYARTARLFASSVKTVRCPRECDDLGCYNDCIKKAYDATSDPDVEWGNPGPPKAAREWSADVAWNKAQKTLYKKCEKLINGRIPYDITDNEHSKVMCRISSNHESVTCWADVRGDCEY